MRITRLLAKFSPLAIAALVGMSGCSDMSAPIESTNIADLAWQGQTLQNELPELLEGLDIEGAYEDFLIGTDGASAKPSGGKKRLINFIEANDTEIEITYGKKWLLKGSYVSADDSTVITFGTDKIGYSTLVFPPGAVDEDVLITLLVKQKGKRDLFLFPEGVVFNRPVTLHYSLQGMNRGALRRWTTLKLFYHNPGEGGWQLIDSYSDGEFVHATLEHFSRYAVGSDN